ncbi:4013_t:CDS:1, partial [Dentiscutata heterogama]
MTQFLLSKGKPIEYTNENIQPEKPTVFSNLANISTALADSILLFLGLRPSENDDRTTPPASSIMMRYGLSPQAMAYVQFKSTRLKGFNEFVIYKNGVMQRDITINIRRDIEVE